MTKQIALRNGQPERKLVQPPKRMLEGGEHIAQSAMPNHLGNAAIQRLLAQRSGDGAFDLDNETAGRINRSRGSGQPLDGAVQTQMGHSMGNDFSGVRVHTGGESHALNEQLNAKAFTTGSDVFFREGAYSPQSSNGQQLIAHELTHVVQQGSGAVGGGGGPMQVNAPGDRFEQEADAVAKTVTSTPAAQAAAPTAQRQALDEDKLQTQRLQRQTPEDQDMLQKAELPDDEQALQKQAMPDKEEEKLG